MIFIKVKFHEKFVEESKKFISETEQQLFFHAIN
jgi:hypothetical protein